MPVLIKRFPPSWFQIRDKEKAIYIDPAYLRTYFTHYPKKIEYSKWPDPIDGLPEELEKADIISITHHHKDHAKCVTVDRLRGANTVIVAPKRCLKELGSSIEVTTAGKEIADGHIGIKAVDAYNTQQGSSSKKVHRKGDGVGYVLTVGGKAIYHAGDTDFITEMKELRNIGVALLPIGGAFTMNISEAVKAALSLSLMLSSPCIIGRPILKCLRISSKLSQTSRSRCCKSEKSIVCKNKCSKQYQRSKDYVPIRFPKSLKIRLTKLIRRSSILGNFNSQSTY
jgi:L-ascorbate metabolism protein UlaG (beta-lactamase superfamily)